MTYSNVNPGVDQVRARAKLLAREHRQMRAKLIGLRERSGLTQAEVGELIGISQQAINKFERYDADPKLSTIRQYANAVGAIIEHHVTLDIGQSVLAAAPSPWESVGTVNPGPVPARRVAVKIQSSAEWAADSKRTDFALSA